MLGELIKASKGSWPEKQFHKHTGVQRHGWKMQGKENGEASERDGGERDRGKRETTCKE